MFYATYYGPGKEPNTRVGEQYELLKEAFKETIEILAQSHPEFKPDVRYNNDARRVEVNHGAEEFATIIPKGSKLSQIFPNHSYKALYPTSAIDLIFSKLSPI